MTKRKEFYALLLSRLPETEKRATLSFIPEHKVVRHAQLILDLLKLLPAEIIPRLIREPDDIDEFHPYRTKFSEAVMYLASYTHTKDDPEDIPMLAADEQDLFMIEQVVFRVLELMSPNDVMEIVRDAAIEG